MISMEGIEEEDEQRGIRESADREEDKRGTERCHIGERETDREREREIAMKRRKTDRQIKRTKSSFVTGRKTGKRERGNETDGEIAREM